MPNWQATRLFGLLVSARQRSLNEMLRFGAAVRPRAAKHGLVDAHRPDLVPNLDWLAGLADICRRLHGIEQGFLPVGVFAVEPSPQQACLLTSGPLSRDRETRPQGRAEGILR